MSWEMDAWLASHVLNHPQYIVSFTGHRPDRLPANGDDQADVWQELKHRLELAILDQLDQGRFIFLNGGMAGWDVIAAETVIRLRESHPRLVSITVLPFFYDLWLKDKSWTPEWYERMRQIYQHSNLSYPLKETYRRGVYHARDRYLIDHSSAVIAYYDGGKGGTHYTLRYARAHRRPCLNLALPK